ncbi:hypothetical protein Gogos_012854 [Gossypium gossypioides]|uniref:Uncharacterized protein n=1 Tax=Gossypium gossypioides TaxID=34282 RepID=A0A7J9BTX1_GOSGO|nr:hypothetical protein [Gossypium gossypioides]
MNVLETTNKLKFLLGKKAFDDLISEINNVNESLVEPFDMRFIAYGDYCKECRDPGGRYGSNENETSLFAYYCRDHPYSTE